MLKIAENHFKSDKAPLLLMDKISKKKVGKKGSNKKRLNPKHGIFKKKNDGIYHYYGKKGYWKRNYKSYLASLKQNINIASKGLYMIHTNFSLSDSAFDSWVLDIICGSHLCKSLQGLQRIQSLNKGDFELFNASGESIHAEAVETYLLKLSSSKILELEDCCYMSRLIRNIISIFLLLQQGFEINAKDNRCSIFLI